MQVPQALWPLLLLAIVPSCDSARSEASAPSAETAPPPVLVRLGSFDRGEISNKLSVSADLEAVAKADLYPEIPGPVAEVLHRLGDPVRKGEPVVRLVDDHLKLLVETKRLMAVQAKGKVLQADVARREAAQTVALKKLRMEKAAAEYARIQRLSQDAQNGLVSSEEAEAKRYEFEEARIDHQTCLVQKEKYELDHAQALESQKLAEVELRTAEYNLSQATLRSPIDGRISYLEVKPGELITATSRVVTVVDTRKLEARLHVPQRELSRIRTGLPVRILCEVFPEKEFQASIDVVNPVVDKVNGTVEVVVGLSDPEGFLKPGMFVNGEVILDTRKEALLVPKKAVSYEDREPIVYLVKEKIAHRYLLKAGYSTRDRIEVLGLVATDGSPASTSDGTLVIIGHNNLKEGSRVEVE
jgi:RND family efflux transporter MFP subunit